VIRAAATGLALVAAALAVHAARAPAQPGAPVSPPARSLTVSLDVRHPGAVIPADFLGLSFEAGDVPMLARDAALGNLAALLRSLGPGVLRIGGASADRSAAWTDGRPPPAWAATTITPADLGGLHLLAKRTGWRVLLTVGLGHFDPVAAAEEVKAARRILGDALAGVEIGNEPDRFVADSLRPATWGFRDYGKEIAAYRRTIARAVRGVPLAGPDISSYLPNLDWVSSAAKSVHPALLTAHFYSANACATPKPALADLVDLTALAIEDDTFSMLASIGRHAHLPVRIDETNNLACGGEPGVSNTAAAALWAAGMLARAMGAGLAGANFHDLPENPAGYSPLAADTPQALARGVLTAEPEWDALRLARSLEGERVVPLRIGPLGLDVRALATVGAGGRMHVLLVDDDPPGSPPLSLRLGLRVASARALLLAAPSPAASSGISLQGGGVPVRGGAVVLSVDPSSAVLLALAPAR
jgi:hypothetical protein